MGHGSPTDGQDDPRFIAYIFTPYEYHEQIHYVLISNLSCFIIQPLSCLFVLKLLFGVVVCNSCNVYGFLELWMVGVQSMFHPNQDT
jgi:hypothetical protein